MSAPTNPKKPTIGGWLEADPRRVPEVYSRRADCDLGTADLPKERYISRTFHEREMQSLWPRVWQMACHEADIPDVGDYITYEIGARSFIIVRIADKSIRAYPNACLHRGTQLVEGCGHVNTFACRFHGWTWDLAGALKRITEDWDFPQTRGRDMSLPSLPVGLWGGFVFINPDRNAGSFESFLGEMPAHFSRVPLEERRIALHVARIMPANWKVALEAFIESYHVMPTHPQSVTVSEYAETQYDIYGPNVSRLATISVAPASESTRSMSAQEFAAHAAKSTGREPVQLAPGETYRNALAAQRRREVAQAQGRSIEHLSDVEMLDAVEYFLFPNFMPWHGFGLPIVYRFRPNGDRHDSSVMEIYLLAPRDLSQPAPKAAPLVWLPEDRPFSEHAALGRLGPIFDQDYGNIVGVWKGLHSLYSSSIILGRYQESRIRHYHRRIDEFLAESIGNEANA